MVGELIRNAGVAFSADDAPGRYDFDDNGKVVAYHPEVDAHGWCQDWTRYYMGQGVSPVVIDNTNLVAEHRAVYEDMAKQHGYRVLLCWIGDGGKTDAELAQRNVHGVPEDRIALMRALLNAGSREAWLARQEATA